MKTTHKIDRKEFIHAPAVALNGEYTKLHSDVCIRESCKCLSFSSSENLSNLSIGKTLGNLSAVNLAGNGVKVEVESQVQPATPEAKCLKKYRGKNDDYPDLSVRLPIARRTTVTDTDSYTVTYLEYKGNQMDKPMKAAFAFFKGIPHSTEVARYKLIAQNLGLTVNSGVAKTVAGAKYLPHSGKKEEQRRAKQEAFKLMKAASKMGVRPELIIYDDVVPDSKVQEMFPAAKLKDVTIGNDQSNLQPIGGNKEDNSKDSN